MKITRNNHDDIYPAGPHYVRAIRAGDTLYLSGCTARNSDASSGPPMDQLRVTLDRIVRIVEAEGGTPANIVAITTYVTDMRPFWPVSEEQHAIYDEFFNGVYPTNSYIGIDSLADPDLVVELTATAVMG